jgi:hypothetical protein
MSKLFATLLAGVFAAATMTPVLAQDKKDAPKADAKMEAKGDAKKADGKKAEAPKADAKKADAPKAEEKKADKK